MEVAGSGAVVGSPLRAGSAGLAVGEPGFEARAGLLGEPGFGDRAVLLGDSGSGPCANPSVLSAMMGQLQLVGRDMTAQVTALKTCQHDGRRSGKGGVLFSGCKEFGTSWQIGPHS